tara:strand:- start:86 stop:634 length:549 start_codon:yes stop_codon:yes gene_type:complete
MMQTFPIFSINAHRIKIEDWSEKHRDRILDLVPEQDEEMLNGGMSDNKIHYTDYFSSLKKVPPYTKELFEVLDPYLEDFFEKNEISRITSVWCQKYKSSDYHAPHDHGSIGYSAVLYAKLDATIHPGTQFFSPFPTEKGCKETLYAKAEEGDLLIFPAHILHMAPPHYDSNELRVIFSFNFL